MLQEGNPFDEKTSERDKHEDSKHENNNNNKNSIKRYDFLSKVLLVGDSFTGKTSVMRRFVNDDFSTEFLSTIVIDFRTKVVKVDDNKSMKLQIW